MKNLNTENGIRWIGLLILCAVFISTGLITGCGSDGDKKAARAGDRRTGGRVNPDDTNDGYTDLLVTGINVSTNGDVELAVELFTPDGEEAYPGYSGAVEAFGYLDYQGPEFQECGFRSGIYDLETPGPSGIYADDSVGVFNWQETVIEAKHRKTNKIAVLSIGSGGYGIAFTKAQPRVGIDGFKYHNSFWGEVFVESFDGHTCYVGSGQFADYRKFFFVQ